MIYVLSPEYRRARRLMDSYRVPVPRWRFLAAEPVLMGVMDPKVIDLYEAVEMGPKYIDMLELLKSRNAVFYSGADMALLLEQHV